MNRKGTIGIDAAFGIVVALLILSVPSQTAKFRERKANEKCIEEGSLPAACEVFVDGMTKNQILNYIRDI